MGIPAGQAIAFFYAQLIPRGLEIPFILLLLYGVYLIAASGILLAALKTAGAKVNFIIDFPRAVLTIVIRDLIALPLIALILLSPIVGIVIAFAAWFVLLRFMFQITIVQAFLVWLASGIIQILLIILVLVPAFLLL